MIFKIAVRNILKNRKRSIFIGVSIFISFFFLLFSYSVGNGVGDHLQIKYKTIQSGDVVVMWENVNEIETEDPGRILFSEFDIKKDEQNKLSTQLLNSYLDKNKFLIKKYFKAIRGFVLLDTKYNVVYCMVNGLSQEELNYLKEKKMLRLELGESLFDHDYGIYISRELAEKYNINLGDWVILDGNTTTGLVNTLDYQVVGIYQNHAPWDNTNIYMTKANTQELLDFYPYHFSSVRIYLNNPEKSIEFSKNLNNYLTYNSTTLVSETSHQAGPFYYSYNKFQKKLFTIFVIILLLVITFGIRALLKITLNERSREFGTLMALGYSRFKILKIILLEIMLITIASFLLSIIVTVVLVLIFNKIGIYVGTGSASYLLGGAYIYPNIILEDMVIAFLLLGLFSLISPLKPAITVALQSTIDLLNQKQRVIHILPTMVKKVLVSTKIAQSLNKIRGLYI